MRLLNQRRQHVCFFWIGDSITIGVAPQSFLRARANFLARLRIRSIHSRMVQYKFVYVGQVDVDATNCDVYSRKASFCRETL